jgi:hypothetical protein
MYFPFVVGSYIISFLIFQLKSLREKFSPESPNGIKFLGTLTGYYLVFSSFFLALIFTVYYPYSFKDSLNYTGKVVLESRPFVDNKNAECIIYLNASSPFLAFYTTDVFRYHYGKYKDVRPLSSFNGKLWIKQLSDSSFVLKTDTKGWISNFFAKISRANPEVETGKKYSNELFTATIIQSTPDKEDVLEVQFDFKVSFFEKDIIFMYYDGEKFGEWKFNSEKNEDWQFVGDSSDALKGMM